MKYTDDYADNKEDQQFIDNERLRHIVERNKVLHGDTIMGEEADRIIEKMQQLGISKRPQHTDGRRLAKPTKGIRVSGGSMSEPHIQFTFGIYVCSATDYFAVGQEVLVDTEWNVYPLLQQTVGRASRPAVDVTLDILFEGLEDPNANVHPSAVTTTTITCSYCQQKGLHWSGQKGVNLHLRDSNGFKHDCGRSKVTINL